MRSVARSLRQLRPVFQRQKCILISGRVAETRFHFEKGYHSLACRVADHAEINLFKNHAFTTTRALSVDAARLTNGGFPLFQALFFFNLNVSLCCIGDGLKLLFPLISFILEFVVSVTEANRAGPLVEYERRISSGELVDGDSCQVTMYL